MDLPAVIFREYDVRGTVGDQLTPAVAYAVGRGLCTITRRRTGKPVPRIAVGRDNRPSGESLARAAADGIVGAGGIAVDVGELPTPALYFSARQLDTDAAVQVTGSHNPPEFNGFKMIVGADSLYGDGIQELHRIISSGEVDSGYGGLDSKPDIIDEYVHVVIERNAPLDRPVKVVVDCGNGVAAVVAERILSGIGADVIPLYCESDGNFPNHHPDPTVIENLEDLKAAVHRTGAELGIAFDGDGDRIGAVDERGSVVYGDKLLILLARDMVRRGFSNFSVIFDVKCSDILREELTGLGLEPVLWKTGHSLIKAKMHETGAALAGEMSGHMFFGGDYFGYDDALFAAARLLGLVAAHPRSTIDSSLGPAAARIYSRDPARLSGRRQVRHRQKGRGVFQRQVRGAHAGRSTDGLSQRMGTLARLEYPAGSGDALRGGNAR